MTRSVTLTALALGLSLASMATAQPLVQARAHSGAGSALPPGADLVSGRIEGVVTDERGAPIAGAIFGLSHVPDQRINTVVATGPGGTVWTTDDGDSWSTLTGVTGFWAVDFASRETGWAVGTGGRILKISFGQ